MSSSPLLRYAFARQHGVAFREGEPLRLLVREGASLRGLGEARRLAGRAFEIEPVSRAIFDRALGDIYASAGLEAAHAAGASYETGDRLASLVDGLPQTADLLDAESDAPIIRLINGLISEAIRMKASDIHVEPFEDRLAIRFRIDGQLREVLSPEARLTSPLVSRIKVMARLDIAEKRLPQDGRMSLSLGAKAVDVRVSTLPARHGERVVMRLLDKDQALFSLSDLGMAPAQEQALAAALSAPNGIVLVTGPTGSGKTTTLYACLQRLNATHANILTVEDPIEYGLDGIGQTQVNPKVGMTFAAGLRAILRQDPDIVMVGEIRDGETAQIAVQASLTGHLVLTTIHTNSAAAAVMRLKDMGVEPFLLASTLQAVLAQRLVRRLCPKCKQAYHPTEAECAAVGTPHHAGLTFYRAVGCEHCHETGYTGRLGLYELLQVTPRLRDLIHDGAREATLEAEAFAHSDTLLESGMRHVLAGETSLDDVMRVCRSEGPSDARI